MWGTSYEYFIEHGDAWIGVTHSPDAIAALKKFNPSRYTSLSMANPTPSESCGPANARSENEEGVKFDIFTQVAAALKSANGPIAGFRAQRVYGTSHTGEIVTYAHAIQPIAKVFDGFVFEANASPAAISHCGLAPGPNDPRRITRNVGVPTIRIVSEGDVPAAYALRREDSDTSNDRFRWYEVAAACGRRIPQAAFILEVIEFDTIPACAIFSLFFCTPSSPSSGWFNPEGYGPSSPSPY
jgi:Alpha/beta hydrolase domain